MKDRNKKTLVIIPAFNEEKNISRVIARIRQIPLPLEILVIDDGSSDRTAEVVGKSRAKVVSLPFNLGYGAALQTGYRYALENNYDYVVQLDGDGQHDPGYIPELLRIVEAGEADLVLGSRFLKKDGNHGYRAGIARKLGIGLFGSITSLMIGQRITDPTSGYQALNRRVVEYCTGDAYPSDYPDADVIIMLHRAGFKMREISVVMFENNTGKSMHSGLNPLYYIFKMFLSIFMTILRRNVKLPVLN